MSHLAQPAKMTQLSCVAQHVVGGLLVESVNQPTYRFKHLIISTRRTVTTEHTRGAITCYQSKITSCHVTGSGHRPEAIITSPLSKKKPMI